MPIHVRGPYEPRSVRFLQILEAEGFRLKVYGISYGRPLPRPELIEAAIAWVTRELRQNPSEQETYGVGFLGIHDGRDANQVFLDLWANENELIHRFVVSPVDEPANLVEPPRDHNTVCCWDLYLQAFERHAWIDKVLCSGCPEDIEPYLEVRLNADV